MDNNPDSNCTCPLEATGSSGRVDSHGRKRESCGEKDDASACIQCCKSRFLTELWPSYSNDTLSGDLCDALSGPSVSQELWHLYWCDSTLCGVWINQTDGIGQDRK